MLPPPVQNSQPSKGEGKENLEVKFLWGSCALGLDIIEIFAVICSASGSADSNPDAEMKPILPTAILSIAFIFVISLHSLS